MSFGRKTGPVRPNRWRRILAVVIAPIALAATLTAPSVAMAAGSPVVTGVISADASGNGAVDTTGAAGKVDKPLAGVTLTLRCATGNAVLATTTTDANGKYTFGDGDLGSCVGNVVVAMDTSGYASNIYATEATGAANQIARVSANTATSAPFAPSAGAVQTINGLLKPTWALTVGLYADPANPGLGGVSVFTGTAPFDTGTGADTTDGQDSSKTNNRVRAGDVISYTWSYSVASADSLAASASNGVFEQVVTMSNGAVANFSDMPGACKTVAGTNPISQIVAMPSGTVVAPRVVPPAGTTSVVLTCNVGPVGQSTGAAFVPTDVWVSSTSTNGGVINTTARAYGVDANGVATVQPSADISNGPINVTAAPRYDVKKTAYTSGSGTKIINGVVTAGYFMTYGITIATDRKLGVEAFTQPITIKDDFWAQYSTGSNGPAGSSVQGLKWYFDTCAPMTTGGITGDIVLGSAAAAKSAGLNANTAVSNSGTCTPSRTGDDSSEYTLTLSGIDATGANYPTTNAAGTADYSAGPYYVASYRMQIFVPVSEIDKSQGTASDSKGQLNFYNKAADFNPVGPDGAQNYGGAGEPGYCQPGIPSSTTTTPATNCATMPTTGAASNNVAGPITVTLNSGSWGKQNGMMRNNWLNINDRFGAALGGGTKGAALIQHGGSAGTQINIVNSSAVPMTGIGLCDVFDNTTAVLTNATNATTNPANAGARPTMSGYAALLESNTPGTAADDAAMWAYQVNNQANFTFQYASVSFGSDNPNNGNLDQASGRYLGDWTNQKAVKCNDASITWYNSPTAAPGGIDSINVVRAVANSSYVLPAGGTASLWLATQPRDTYNGGPHAGQTIPAGTVIADFAAVTTNQSLSNGWNNTRSYDPINNLGAGDGDRYTLARATLNVKKKAVNIGGIGQGVSDFGVAGSANAGDQIVWEMDSSLQSTGISGSPVNNVVITDVLPKYNSYDSLCTTGLKGGTPPSTITNNADGTTTLVWNLGSIVPNTPIAPRIICTNADSLAPGNTNLVNDVKITGDKVIYIDSQAHDTHTIVLKQAGNVSLKKVVDRPLDLQNGTQDYQLIMKNMTAGINIPSPSIYEVLSYVGDGSNAANVNRAPASKFSGTNTLTGPVTAFDFSGTTSVPGTFLYTTAAPASVPQDMNADTDPSIWTANPTDWSKVTGFKFTATNPLVGTGTSVNGSGLILKYTTKQTGNMPGDWYANRFTAFSPALTTPDPVTGKQTLQKLTSNQTNVYVVGFSLGDLIWTDNNGDGVYQAGVDTPAPAGVTVQVFQSGNPAPVATTTTDANGRWIVNNLPVGDYYAEIPATMFAPGALLDGKKAAPGGVDSSIPNNENLDHNAVQDGQGVRTSGVVSFAAITDTATQLVGNGPLNDNVANLALPSGVTDDFTNLTADMALVDVPGYTFKKTSDPVSGTPVVPGGTITYTLTGANTGNTVLNPVTVSDDLSKVLNNATLVAGSLSATVGGVPATTAPTLTGTTVNWTGSLAGRQSVVITYKVTVNADAAGQILNNTASSSATPPTGPPITPPPGTTTHPVPGYTFTKTADPASGKAVPAGGTINYTLTGTNTGATVLDPVVINDDLSKVLNNTTLTAGSLKATINGNAAPNAPTVTDGTLTWTGVLQPGDVVVLTYSVVVNDGAVGQVVTNTATSSATPPGLPPLTPPPGSTEHPVPGYTFVKSSNPSSGTAVLPGGTITYTLTGTNNGATVLDPVNITDDLSKVLNNAKLTTAAAAKVNGVDATAPTLNGTTLSWTGSLPAGAAVVITYTVTVNDDAAGQVLNNVANSSATPPGLPPITPPPGTTTHPVPGYTFAKTSDPASGAAVAAGGTITYKLTGTNKGATVLDPVTINDDLSKVLNNSSMTVAPSATINGTATTAPTIDGTTLTWTGTLQPSDVVVISYTVTVNADAAGSTLTNTATSSATPPGVPPITPPPGTTEHPVPGYTFTKTADPESGTPVLAGGTITYTLTGTNTGATVLDPVTVSDDLSKVLNNATMTKAPSATVNGELGTAPTIADNALNWSGNLPVGASVVITYTVTVNANAAGQIINNAAGSSATPPGLPPITPPEVTTEHPVPGYTFLKTADPADGSAVMAGGTITYTLTGTNNGATVLDPVTVSDDLSKVLDNATMSVVPAATINGTPSAVAPSVSGTSLSWVGSLQPGDIVSITYTVKINDDAQGATLSNTATSSGKPPVIPPITPPPGTTEHPVPGYTFTKVSTPDTKTAVNQNGTITYTLTGTNTGATVLAPVNISDDLSKVLNNAKMTTDPVATVNGAAGTAPTVRGTTLNWTGTLPIGAAVVITYTVTVNGDAAGAIIDNVATSSATPPGLPPITPPPGETTHPVPGYTFAKTSDPASGSAVMAGGTIAYTLTGTNTGATVLEPVTISDDLSKVLNNAKMTVEPALTLNGQPASAPTLDGTTLTWTGTLQPGDIVKVTYSVTVNQGTEGKVLNNTATSSATPPGLPPITPPPGTTEHPVPGYTFAKVSDPATGTSVNPGGTITYTLTGANTGATALSDVNVNDDLSEVLNNAKITTAAVATINGETASNAVKIDNDKLSWTGDLPVGATVVITYTVTLNQDAAGIIVHNVATSSATPPGLPPITPPPGETWHPTPGFTFMKTADPVSGTTVHAGEIIKYTLTGNNFGQTVLNPVVVTDDLSKVVPFADVDMKSLAATVNGEAVNAPTVQGTTLTWTGKLDIGQVVTVTYSVKVKSGVESMDSVVKNIAGASATPPTGPAIVPPKVTTEHPIPGFALTKTSDPKSGSTVKSGDVITYTVKGVNTGATVLNPVAIKDDLSKVLNASTLQGAPIVTIEGPGAAKAPEAKVTGTTLNWNGSLAPGQSVSIVYKVKVSTVKVATTLLNVAAGTWQPPTGPPGTVPPVTTEHKVTPPPVVPTTPGQPGKPSLPNTGAHLIGWTSGLALLLMGAGAFLLVARKRRHQS